MSEIPSKSLVTAEDLETALTITPLFYDAVLDPKHWPDVLKTVGEWFAPFKAGQIALSRISNIRALAHFTHGLTDEELELYLSFDDHVNGDPRTKEVIRRYNSPWHCRQTVSEADLHASPIYKKVFHPLNIEYSLATVLTYEDRDAFISFAIARPRAAPPFTQHDVDKLQLLLPHLRRAGEVYSKLLITENRCLQLEQAFDNIELATFFFDHDGRVIYANPPASRLAEKHAGIELTDGRIKIHDASANAEFTAHFHEATQRPGLDKSKRVRHVIIPRGPATEPLRATICSLAADSDTGASWLASQTQAAVFLTDPNTSYETSSEKLQRLFGLTATEGKVLSALVSGASPKEIAEQSGRSLETVRRHIKNIMSKTNTHRQAKLVKLAYSR